MRMTMVPAQITTVEDKIAGNLGLAQISLLIAPIFGGSATFVILPPFFNYAAYKVALIACMALVCGGLAIRIKGKILLLWTVVILRYNLRPTFYVFDKNSAYARVPAAPLPSHQPVREAKAQMVKKRRPTVLKPAERLEVEQVVANPAADVRFITDKKGGLHVRITEVAGQGIGTSSN